MDSNRFRENFQLRFKRQYVPWKPLLLILFATIASTTSHAQQTFKLTVADGFCLSSQEFQYRHVEISTSNGLPAARDISVWCHVEIQGSWRRVAKLVRPIPVTLKAGEVRVEKQLYLPTAGVAGMVCFSLTETDNARTRLLESTWGNRDIPWQRVLIVDGVGVGESQVAFNRNRRVTQPGQTPRSYSQVGGVSQGNRMNLCCSHSKIAYLPKRWIGYSSVDQVILTSPDFATLAQDRERFEALIQWVTMGGALIVSDCGDDFNCISSIRRYFKDGEPGGVPKMRLYLPNEDLKSVCEELSVNYRVHPLSVHTTSAVSERLFNSWNEVAGAVGEKGGQKFNGETKVKKETKFLLHRLGLGSIVFHSAPVSDQNETELLRASFLSLAAQRDESNALGAKNSAGDSYLKWQLLNVGIAPIGLFIFVVLSFMMLIGPVGYSYLKIKQKLNYQIWLVPLISALACLSLLGYAFLSEGVGTKLRPTIYVELDQHRKVAATFARYSVYSALQPPPYRFGDDQFATMENAGDGTPAVYYWADDGYRITGGNASARNVHQVFVAAPVETDSGIEVKKANDSESTSSIRLTSKFKNPVRLLALKHDGELFFVTDLATSETKVATHIVDGELAQSDNVKKLLKEILPTNTQDYRFSPQGRFYNRSSSQNQEEWDIGVKQIEKFRSARGIEDNLEDGHYIAILDSMEEVPSVVAGAREIDGSVIVHGKW